MSGRFISFEGIDGAGKTTHIAAVAGHVRRAGDGAVLVTREPGGTPLAERLRSLVLGEPMDALTESLLVFAARRDHVLRVIEPALRRGETVLCDRFTDASFAYQGGGRGVESARLQTLECWVHDGLQPDLTLWFDVGVRDAAARRALRQPLSVTGDTTPTGDATPAGDAAVAGDAATPPVALQKPAAAAPDRFERQDDAFFERVRAAYAERQVQAPGRIVRIDAESSRERVWQQIAAALAQRGW